MDAARIACYELERLVDRQIELCELFDGKMPMGRKAAPFLVTMSEGKAISKCYTDLADRALIAYEGSGFAGDTAIYALKVALVQAIVDMS
jgi:hypothetical protein